MIFIFILFFCIGTGCNGQTTVDEEQTSVEQQSSDDKQQSSEKKEKFKEPTIEEKWRDVPNISNYNNTDNWNKFFNISGDLYIGNDRDLTEDEKVNMLDESTENFKIDVLSAPVIVLSGSYISWTTIPNADYYRILCIEDKDYESKTTDTKWKPDNGYQKHFYVVAVSNKDFIFDSADSNVVYYDIS